MKTIILSTVLCFALFANSSFAQTDDKTDVSDSTGLPGDNFSLQGALDYFKAATSLEDFETKLNAQDNDVNNLDLDGDGNTDYIRVVDNMKDSIHAIVLQISVSESETQDVAVIELEKNGSASAIVQIVGDEELYGDNTFVEPIAESEIKGGKGPLVSTPTFSAIIVNVWLWPCVKFVYAPAYVVWASPWKWHKYPPYWKPWKIHPLYIHRQRCVRYHTYFHPVPVHRVIVVHNFYKPYRKVSTVVVVKNKPAHATYRANHPKGQQSTIGKPQNQGKNGKQQPNNGKVKQNQKMNQQPAKVGPGKAGNKRGVGKGGK